MVNIHHRLAGEEGGEEGGAYKEEKKIAASETLGLKKDATACKKDRNTAASETLGMKVAASDDAFVFTGKEMPPTDVTKVVFSSTITEVVWHPHSHLCMADCKKLMEVVLNEGLRRTGGQAFRDCSSLKCITFPSTLNEIGYRAFENCTSLSTVVLKKNLRAIRLRAFQGCSMLNRIYIPSTVNKAGDSICTGSNKLNEGLQMIGERAFWGCTSLERIHIPLTVTTVGRSAFVNCSSLKEVRVSLNQKLLNDEKLREVESWGVHKRFISYLSEVLKISLVLPYSISRRLEHIIQTGQTDIKRRIDEIDRVVEIRDKDILIRPRRNRTQWRLVEQIVRKIVRVIECFEFNEAMTIFALALWKTNIKEKKAFTLEDRGACRRPVPWPVKESILQYSSMTAKHICEILTGTVEHVYMGKEEVRKDVTRVVFHPSVTEVADLAFSEYFGLKEVVFNEGLQKVGDAAFRNCSNLKKVALNERLQHIGYEAFRGCPLESFDLPHISRRLEGIGQEGQQQVEIMIHGTSRIRRIGGKISISAKGLRSGARWNEHHKTLKQLNTLITYYKMKESMEIVELALWKAMIKAYNAATFSEREACRIPIPEPAKDTIVQFLSQICKTS